MMKDAILSQAKDGDTNLISHPEPISKRPEVKEISIIKSFTSWGRRKKAVR